MATKNIYVKDSDVPLVERAEKELGGSLSATFADCLRSKLGPERPTQMQRIKLQMGDPPVTKVFEGRWLVGDDENGIQAEPDNSGVQWGCYKTLYSVAQTKHGRIVVYERDPDEVEYGDRQMEIYESFEAFNNAKNGQYPAYPQNVKAAAASAIEVPFEVELDI